MKYYRIARYSIFIGGLLRFPISTSKATSKTIIAFGLRGFKKKQISTVFEMVTDSSVSANKFHIAMLAFACIGKDAIWSPAVTVSVLFTGFSGK